MLVYYLMAFFTKQQLNSTVADVKRMSFNIIFTLSFVS